MRVREHFLLGTDKATISVTAKMDCDRETLFQQAIESILARYQEEFGKDACQRYIKLLSSTEREDINWRIRPEDSCWNRITRD